MAVKEGNEKKESRKLPMKVQNMCFAVLEVLQQREPELLDSRSIISMQLIL